MYSTLMVYLEPHRDNTYLLAATRDLAERSGAAVIGVSAGRQFYLGYAVRGVSGDIFELDRQEIQRSMAAAEFEFRAALEHPGRHIEWHAIVTSSPPIGQLASQVRSADLLITGSGRGGTSGVDAGDLVMRAGRPVLVVPAGTDKLTAQNALVAWKDSPEARRAISDGLVFLKTAGHVQVVEIADAEGIAEARRSVEDVVHWLKRHGIGADGKAVPETGDHALQLAAIAKEEGADLIIAGAYGHSRFHEWVLGGVTSDLLLRSRVPTLLSH